MRAERAAFASAAAVMAALGGALAATPALAAEPATLAVTRGEGATSCPDAEALARGVARAAGRTSDASLAAIGDSTRADYVVAFGADARGYEAHIVVERARGGGERRLSDAGATCDALGDAVALTLAVLLDDARARAAAAAPPPPPAPAPPPPSPAEPSAARPSRVGVVVDAGAAALSGVVRPWAPAFFVAGSIEPPGPLSLGLEGTFVPRQELALGPGTVGVTFVGGAVLLCATPIGRRESLRAGACLFPEIGAVSAEGRGYTSGASATRPWVAGGAELVVRSVIAGPVGFRVHAGAAVPLRREAFGVERVGVAYDPPAIAAFAGLGLSANLR